MDSHATVHLTVRLRAVRFVRLLCGMHGTSLQLMRWNHETVRNALSERFGLVVLALPAQAARTTTVTDNPVLSTTKSAPPVQLAQRPYDPSAGSVGFKKSKKKKEEEESERKRRFTGPGQLDLPGPFLFPGHAMFTWTLARLRCAARRPVAAPATPAAARRQSRDDRSRAPKRIDDRVHRRRQRACDADSPAPFTPIGLVAHRHAVVPVASCGMSVARGIT
jgi:hypothetical protein